ncbi:choline/carnitine/betaine transport [Galbibacter orientalis DSM 19592]|uniref:Choline/carnitine/betaine transport n=1 Tax=Galbibacter orientalis DSM 19592 TaxID=926559 RepID=I3C829_9FLAO|nr:BCCT family transporter [Galbibacter orientalis]EIJ39772.1 choline/carnitine/betaine transport [Galbibacter orientalis DSM 19592]
MKEKETNEIVNPEVQLEIDSMVEEYEIELRKELDLSKANSYKEIEKKKRTFKARVIENELDDIRRDVKEIRDEEKSIIGINFWISLFVTVLVMIFAFSAGEDLADFAQWIAGFVTKYLNWFYVLVASGFLIFLLFLASGRFGSVVLGHPDERPEFSNFSWYSMLFSAGMGVGILFYGSAEPMSHFLNSPVDPSGSAAAATSAMTYSAFHWGLHAWGIYTVCAVGIAYYGFRKRKRYLVSSSILNFTSNKKIQTVVKSTTDLISILAVIFGVSTSLGVGVLQISKGLNHVFDMETSNFMGYAVIISIITLVFIVSSSTGLKKGIRILSNLNMIIAILLLLFVFIVGNTLFDLKVFVNSIGQYLQELPALSFRLNPYDANYENWMGDWTLSYFTWWIAWAPFVGIFIARISKGRTVRELIVGCLLVPAIFSLFWFSVFGGTAIHLEMIDKIPIGGAMLKEISVGTFLLFEQLPLSSVTSVTALFLLFTFLVTSADSATFVISMMTSEGDLDPTMKMKITWGIVLGVLSLVLLAGGGIKALQAATLIFAFPFSFVLIMIARSLYFRLSIQVKKKRS